MINWTRSGRRQVYMEIFLLRFVEGVRNKTVRMVVSRTEKRTKFFVIIKQ